VKRLLLFDIDGTILDSGGTGLGALRDGIVNAFDLQSRADAMPDLDLAGATDASVARELFAAFGIQDTPEHRQQFFDSYATALRTAFIENGDCARLLPGIQQLLGKLEAENNAHLGLLTGNIETGARIKLGHFGVDSHFAFGAFGDDAEHRDELGPIALDRARRHVGASIEPSHSVVIGDTPRDIACARAAGMKVIAVATGGFSLFELKSCEPDAVLANFEDVSATAELIRVI
jgi:phosphoglycolate phosphatase